MKRKEKPKRMREREKNAVLSKNIFCSFNATFINTLFNLLSLKNTFCSEQTNAWFKIKGDYFGLLPEKIEKVYGSQDRLP